MSSKIALGAILTGAVTMDNSLNLQPGAVGAKYVISSANPTEDRNYMMPDMGVDGSLSVVEEASHVTSYVDDTESITYLEKVEHRISRRNNQVTITLPDDSIPFSGSSTQVRMQKPIPSRFCPSPGSQYLPALIASNAISQFGLIEVGKDGIVIWYSDPARTRWSGRESDILFGTSITYNIQ